VQGVFQLHGLMQLAEARVDLAFADEDLAFDHRELARV